MFKYIVALFLVVFGVRYGYNYLNSEDFQRWGDEHHAEWTCKVNNLLGNINMTMSRYDEALHWFGPVLKRCPDTPMAEEATFRTAISLETMGRRQEAAVIYRTYAEKYKGTERSRIATKAAEIITGP